MNPLDEFRQNCDRSLLTIGTGRDIQAISSGVIPTDDLARAAVVSCVSAFDTLMHRLMFDLAWVKYCEDPSGVFGSSMACWLGVKLGSPEFVDLTRDSYQFQIAYRQKIAYRLSKKTLQNPVKVSEAFEHFGVLDIWDPSRWKSHRGEISRPKEALGAIVDRRNRIAHQCDIDLSSSETSTFPLSLDDARLAVDQVRCIGVVIASFVEVS